MGGWALLHMLTTSHNISVISVIDIIRGVSTGTVEELHLVWCSRHVATSGDEYVFST